jgi:hypothetical protein
VSASDPPGQGPRQGQVDEDPRPFELPDDDSPHAGAGLVHALIERLALTYGQEPYREEIARAREAYFAQAGKVFEDDGDLFERRVAAFLEWYLCERPLGDGAPPVVQALEGAGSRFTAEERRALAWIAASHRSLFDLTDVGGGRILLEDVVSGARFSVRERRSTVGFEVGDLLEARLCWNGAEVVFGKTFLFHPRDAREQVLDLIDASLARGDGRDAIVFQLSRLHVRWHRLGHVGAARVYREGLLRQGGKE